MTMEPTTTKTQTEGTQAAVPAAPFGAKVRAFFSRLDVLGGLALALGGLALATRTRPTTRVPLLPPPAEPPPQWPPRLPSRALTTVNREKGALLEAVVGERLPAAFPNAGIIPQLTVMTPDGERRRVDFALAHPNGSVTAVEVKNVPVLEEKHVRQAEEQREALKHTCDVRSGRPYVAVPGSTVVPDELAGRVRVLRVTEGRGPTAGPARSGGRRRRRG